MLLYIVLSSSTTIVLFTCPFFSPKTDRLSSTPLGNVTWQSFSIRYDGDVPEGTVPQWMTSEYDVWFCDPHTIIKNMIDSPDYNHHIDVALLWIFNSNGTRVYQNFMSGDWAWEEAVSTIIFILSSCPSL